MPPTAATIQLDPGEAHARWSGPLLAAARAALGRAQNRLGLTLDGTVTIRTFDSQYELERFLGSRPTHVLAVAVPESQTVAILWPAWRDADPDDFLPVLVHEMVHLILARRVRGALPAWLNEGMAMLASGESGVADRLRLNVAGVMGTLLTLDEIETTVLLGGERQSLAYAESLSATRYLLRRSYGGDVDLDVALKTFAGLLADPDRGPYLLRQLRDPLYREALDRQWRRGHETFWAWVSFLSGTAFLWMGITLLFLLVYWRKRRMAQLIRERFAEEEADDLDLPPLPPTVEDFSVDGEESDDDDGDRPPWLR